MTLFLFKNLSNNTQFCIQASNKLEAFIIAKRLVSSIKYCTTISIKEVNKRNIEIINRVE